MAEPVPEEDRPVVRPTDIPGLRSREREATPANQNSSDKKGEASASAPGSGGFYNPGGDSGAVSVAGLAAAETSEGEQSSVLGAGFNPVDSAAGRLRTAFRNNRRKALIGGGAGAGLVALVIGGFLALAPLKVISFVETLENRYSASSNDALQKETDNLFSNYVKKVVMPGMRKNGCTTLKINKDCTSAVSSTSPVSSLYKGWQQGRLENKLANDYGIEFYKQGGHFYMRAPGLSNNVNLDSFSTGRTPSLFSVAQVNRAQTRVAIQDALQNETFFKRTMLRFQVNKLLKVKYGQRLCVTACVLGRARVDQVRDWGDNKKLAFKVFLAQRVLEPHSEVLGLIAQCVLDNGCDPSNNDVRSTGVNGARQSSFDRNLQQKLDDLAARYGNEAIKDLVRRTSNDILKDGFKNYALKKALTSVGMSEANTQLAVDKLPLVGEINAAAQITQFLHDAGPKFKKLTYAANSALMVSTFVLLRTEGNEAKSGNVDATMVGSFASALGPGTEKDGSGAPAEATPLYQSVVDNDYSPNGVPTTLTSLLSVPKAAAAGTSAQPNTSNYKCDDGKAVRASKLICPEENLKDGNYITQALGGISGILSLPGINALSEAAKIWNETAGRFLGLAGEIYNAPSTLTTALIPSSIKDIFTKWGSQFISDVINKVIPSPASDNMSGGRTGDLAIGGADVLYNDSAHHNLGGVALTPKQSAAIINSQLSDQQVAFNQSPLFARMFSTDTPYSLVSRMASAMPANVNSAGSNVAGLLNPLSSLGHGFSSLFSSPRAFAAAQPQDDPFGVTQYGYPADDPVFTTDPDQYWTDHHCSDEVKSNFNDDYNNKAVLNTETGEWENTGNTDGCMLLQATLQSSGAFYGVSQ